MPPHARSFTIMTPTTNPSAIIPRFNPDPSVVRVGDDYFLVISTFEYFPGVPIYQSKDLVNWRIIGHAMNRACQLNMQRVDPGGGIHAPTLRYYKGRMATTCVYSRQGLLVSYGLEKGIHVWPASHLQQLNETRGFYVSTADIWNEMPGLIRSTSTWSGLTKT